MLRQVGVEPCGFLVDVFWACELSHWLCLSGLVLVVHLAMEWGREPNLGGHELLAFTLRTLENVPRQKCKTLSE